MYQVAVCAPNASQLVGGMQRGKLGGTEVLFSVITHNWEIRRASNQEHRLIDGVCLASEKHLRVNVCTLSHPGFGYLE